MNFELGKRSEDTKMTTTFKHYDVSECDGEVMTSAYLVKGEVPKLNFEYNINGDQQWVLL